MPTGQPGINLPVGAYRLVRRLDKKRTQKRLDSCARLKFGLNRVCDDPLDTFQRETTRNDPPSQITGSFSENANPGKLVRNFVRDIFRNESKG
jgi:hypothetical protein